MSYPARLVVGGVALVGCAMPNPAFDPYDVADESAGASDDGQAEAVDAGQELGDGDGDPNGDGDGDPPGDGDGDGCTLDQLFCDGICVVPNTNEHCGSCDPCDGQCIDQVCTYDHVMFVTNGYFPGKFASDLLLGIDQANAVCQAAADLGVVPTGEYIAWLSSADYAAAEQFKPSSRFLRPDGQVIANSLADLLDGTLGAKIIVTEQNMMLGLGNPCNPYALVWTGTASNGEAVADNCDGWLSGVGLGGTGFAHASDGNWAQSVACNNGVSSCEQLHKLYCVQL